MDSLFTALKTSQEDTNKVYTLLNISDQFKIPVKYIGVGEKINDLQVFNAAEFVDSFFSRA